MKSTAKEGTAQKDPVNNPPTDGCGRTRGRALLSNARHGRIPPMPAAAISPRTIFPSGAARQGGQSEGTTEAPTG